MTGIGEEMLYETIKIEVENSLEYAHLDVYSLEYSSEMPGSAKRPMVLICPGGAYCFTSHREGEPIAMKFLAEGIQAAVLWYSVKPAVFPTALTETAYSVKYLRENAERYHIDPERIVVCGFSAGGHLACSYGCFWNRDYVARAVGLDASDNEILRPNGMILGYPVISAGEFAHRGSFDALSGTQEISEQEQYSLENAVSDAVPRSFIWHTRTDGAVPVENTLMFVCALQKCGINYELHIYPEGGHGLSLGNDVTLSGHGYENVPAVQNWIGMACRWVKNL